MMEWFSRKLVDWQMNKSILTEGDRELYQYAYEMLLNRIVNILIAFLIALIFRSPMPIFIFLASYIPLRSYCGGHHANTNGGCVVVSTLLMCLVCWSIVVMPVAIAAILPPFAFTISGVLVFMLAPVPHRNKPLDEQEIRRYRKRGRLVWFAESVVGIAFFFLKGSSGVVIAVSHLIFSFMLCLGALRNRKYTL